MASQEEEETKRITLIASMVTIVVLAAIGAGFADCEISDYRRQQCIEQTHDVSGCARAYSVKGNK